MFICFGALSNVQLREENDLCIFYNTSCHHYLGENNFPISRTLLLKNRMIGGLKFSPTLPFCCIMFENYCNSSERTILCLKRSLIIKKVSISAWQDWKMLLQCGKSKQSSFLNIISSVTLTPNIWCHRYRVTLLTNSTREAS